MKDFFLSYTYEDTSWAEWIAWQLETSGYSVIIQEWDFTPGCNFVVEMQKASKNTEATIAIVSESYLSKPFPSSEWAAAFNKDPDGMAQSFIPIKISGVKLDGLLASIVAIDLADVRDELRAAEKLIRGVNKSRKKPLEPPLFPARENVPGDFRPSYPNNKMPSSRLASFICQKISSKSILNLDEIDYPYGIINDPTDLMEDYGSESIANIFLWLPNIQYFKSSVLNKYTPCVALCFDKSKHQKKLLNSFTDERIKKLLNLRSSKMTNEDREKIFAAMAKIFHRCLVAAITLPSSMLATGRKNPLIAYNTFLDMMLVPLAHMHKRHNVENIKLILPRSSNEVKGLVNSSKRIVKAIYYKRNGFDVQVVTDDSDWSTLEEMARIIAWAVGAAHNRRNEKWLRFFESEIESAAFSHSEETAP